MLYLKGILIKLLICCGQSVSNPKEAGKGRVFVIKAPQISLAS